VAVQFILGAVDPSAYWVITALMRCYLAWDIVRISRIQGAARTLD